ncbi:cytochrome c peroxidase [Mucilaginibacter gracilis]|uniref:Cytochrome c peroxidase n=1 Tax=Mucilaginibacter gracilis TaxID=423350 RepID=A0A495IXH3_9SPHI|nr:cytochrome c peroxidase [Mucilaginibacter gracilis]RKR80579.1 cytochrome c peroxidase [Mucilaginibacter gracilis]
MKAKGIVFLVLLIFIMVSTAFNYGFKGINYSIAADSVRFAVPANFPKPVYDFKDNPVTSNGFKLGRILFYDPIISKDKSISCANCHQSFAAFANLDHAVSHGVDECLGTRNAPPLFNLAWQKEFMWDGGVHHIEVSPMNAMTNPCEMATDLNTIVSRLQETNAYAPLFKAAFGTTEINSQRTFRALAQFTSMLVSANSKYDKYIRKEKGGDFTAEEIAGYALFKQKCSTCHQEPLFTDLAYRSNGLDLKPEDIGRDSITHLETDRGKFRVPSLRNVELTSPYMHDGRFETLKEVLAHYNSGVKPTANLDPLLHQNNVYGIRLTTLEQSQLIAFLKTLTDRDFVNDKRFQAPE